MEQQFFQICFNFQHSQTNPKEFEQLADIFLKYFNVYASSKIYFRKKQSVLHLPHKPNAVLKKTTGK